MNCQNRMKILDVARNVVKTQLDDVMKVIVGTYPALMTYEKSPNAHATDALTKNLKRLRTEAESLENKCVGWQGAVTDFKNDFDDEVMNRAKKEKKDKDLKDDCSNALNYVTVSKEEGTSIKNVAKQFKTLVNDAKAAGVPGL